MYRVLTIAGSDSCSGAGVQADLKTINALGAYGTCAITAITVQNTLGVRSVFEVPASFVGQQIDTVVTDIGADSLKTGMLVNDEIVEVVCNRIKKYNLKKIVVDPIIESHKGERLLSSGGVKKLRSVLIPLSYLVTPNVPEAEVLAGLKISNSSDMKDAAKSIYKQGAANVLIKGGHIARQTNCEENVLKGEIVDVFYDGKSFEYLKEDRIKTENVHGTGCIYSAAIATELAKGNDLAGSINDAKEFVTKIIKNPLALGKGYKLAHFP
ncbi:MAG: phosphomethylpyrimidine kinase [Candidatus Scalindua rubra]|uniref:hydroxymethylpyrimidine kinase n=1 Tax=Candidatus Scalindua rubra TaxID=1872076 RepID=A0A1E3XAA3_9BACT|nr:MAG: phosphomethylpyrimidine kinase [Candidatus Scalindua rubra]